ncbi:uncharacterized protein LOC126267408 [Schistocerca gregaria]|uniref:uncharacterized protein LOC126267408 n=1 Tax=Schistocerca gregaria TaxID=7010 RepID=UPI00211DF976|nr:uncharacterized protein LOC126267408 [Schistocerca gregaria]
MSSTSADCNNEISSPSFKVNDNDTDENRNVDVCGDDDCVIIKVVEKTPLHKMCGHKLQTRIDSINLQPTISKERGLNNGSENIRPNDSIFPAQPGQEQLRRNPKRLAKQLNNRKRRLESKYDFSYIPAHKFAPKKKKILKCTKEIHTHIDSSNQNKLLAENKDARAQLPCNKQINERTADNNEEHALNKVRTRSRCTEASEFAPPSPEKLWEWREWPAEGMHERPVYQDSQDRKHLQEVAHHALHAVLAFCVMVCNQKTTSESAYSSNKCLKNFISSKKYSEVCGSKCKHDNCSTNDLIWGKEVLSPCYTKPLTGFFQLEEQVHVSSHETGISKLLSTEEKTKINNEVRRVRDQRVHYGKEVENILNSSNSSTVSGDSGDLIIAENEDENEQESITPVLHTEKSSDYKDKVLTVKSNDHLTSVIRQEFISQASCTGFQEGHQDKPRVLRDQLCKWKKSVPGATRSELHFLRQDMKNLFTEELPKTMNDNVTLEDLQDLINYTALLYCLVCSVPQSALAHYINSLTPSSILEWLSEVSQNMQIE